MYSGLYWMVRAGPRLTLLITGWACTICIRILFLLLLCVLILRYVTICDDGYQRKLGIFCVCLCVSPSQTLSFLNSGSFWSYSLEEQMWHLCWLRLMKWQIIGAVPCVGSSLPSILCIVQILHDLFADGSSIKAFKKIVCWTNYWKHRMQLFPWISLKPDAELTKPGALGFL